MSLLTKKNQVRLELASSGFLQKDGNNKFDNYLYFSEAQYKHLFTKFFSKFGIEFSADVDDVIEFTGTVKMPFGRRVKMIFTLYDVESGEKEIVRCQGEGTDKGDKALYKAMTGAVKYYFANNFIVATGDDPETEGGDQGTPLKITVDDAKIITSVYGSLNKIPELLEAKGVSDVKELSYEVGREIVEKLKEKQKEKQKD